MYTYIHTYDSIIVYIHAYSSTYVYVYIYVYMYKHIHIYTHYGPEPQGNTCVTCCLFMSTVVGLKRFNTIPQ